MELWTFDSPAEYRWRDWFYTKRNVVVYPLITVYLIGILWGQKEMRRRKAFDLQRPLFLWNVLLAVFSICGTINTLPEMLAYFQRSHPWHTSICVNDHRSSSARFWFLLFVLSKAVELGDTVFIILRKRPLIFLHWYHHTSILWVCWIWYHSNNSTAGWYCALNYCVHSIMYSYYAYRALNLSVAPVVSMAITFVQVVQMVLGLGTSLYALIMKLQGQPCDTDLTHAFAATLVAASYLFLFSQFFRNTYFSKRTKKVV